MHPPDYRERQHKPHYVRVYHADRIPAGKPFVFASRPGRPMVKDPVTGAILSLAKWNERQSQRNGTRAR